tara:strand:- start:229 stop:492 length:264 start_codon:yes stop_codon:yes gene_type:complete
VSKVDVSIKKKTIKEAYNSIMLLNQIGTTYAQKGEPIYDLVMEIKRDLKRQMRQPKVNVWKELLDFWPLSIVVPLGLLSILWGAYAL